MFKPDLNASYQMPAHFGPRYVGPGTSGWYHDVTMMIVSYETDRHALQQYLPAPLEVAEIPVVTVTYACNKQVDWLAGHGYNLIGVSAAVRFNGEKDQLEGDYTLVMWENLADPILSGRELQGIPKIYADIPEHRVRDGRWNYTAQHFGNPIVDMAIDQLRAPTAAEIEASAAEKAGRDNPIGWRYLPAVGGYGQPQHEFTTFPSATTIHEAQVGVGTVNWQSLTWEQNPTQFHIVNALAGLPVVAYRPAIVARGSTNLVLPERPTRILK